MRKSLMRLAASLIALLLFSGTLAHGATQAVREESKQEIILATPSIVVGSITINDKKQVVIVIKGADARTLKKQCGCEYGEFPELNLVILLDDSMEI